MKHMIHKEDVTAIKIYSGQIYKQKPWEIHKEASRKCKSKPQDLSLHTCQDDYFQKDKRQCWWQHGKIGPLCSVDGNVNGEQYCGSSKVKNKTTWWSSNPAAGEIISISLSWASQVTVVVKNPPANAGDIRDADSIPRSGRSPGGGETTHSSSLAWKIPRTEEPYGL